MQDLLHGVMGLIGMRHLQVQGGGAGAGQGRVRVVTESEGVKTGRGKGRVLKKGDEDGEGRVGRKRGKAR